MVTWNLLLKEIWIVFGQENLYLIGNEDLSGSRSLDRNPWSSSFGIKRRGASSAAKAHTGQACRAHL